MKKNSTIYLDYAAGTPMDPRVKREILTHLDVFGNASSAHAAGRRAKEVIENARARVGKVLNCQPEEIVFTGSGSEANNLAIFQQHGHIVSTVIEHHSVLRPLERHGNVTYVPVKPNGIVDSDEIKKALRPDTTLVSVIYANNEIGTIQPIARIAKAIREASNLKHQIPVFHTDACQAAGALDLNVQNLGVDLMTLNGSKIYGPKGVGCLFVRRGTRLAPMVLGGDQERGLRAGTPNPALIAGFAKALEIADAMKKKESARLTKLRDYAIARILDEIPRSHLNGDPIKRLPNSINISFANIDGEMLMLRLDLRGICVSTGAACTTSSNEPSHVLRALDKAQGRTPSQARGNIRITIGRSTTKKDLEYVVEVLKKEVARLRALS